MGVKRLLASPLSVQPLEGLTDVPNSENTVGVYSTPGTIAIILNKNIIGSVANISWLCRKKTLTCLTVNAW